MIFVVLMCILACTVSTIQSIEIMAFNETQVVQIAVKHVCNAVNISRACRPVGGSMWLSIRADR